ncbi:hypothetical protein A3K24_02880 [candidate division Kazan bacterium RIFCSPHIGHO2_01_FULL_44_14]|uniref:Uncharacterized protein n=1 Tax=candidate division Kazan bacterium RIFCSPLOWO2_01_FULL_45_19 TaxID=1798538 RepID=A0A1F4NQR0_UNCK3|nr:hypothetical protein [uncultured bacterium]OGB73750.1 MAG: hypothetical protein A3K51_02880 [candidate division Kazan bacterium RIFCSPLOWO2_01_FULL_45_19]OGB77995.1 MAG: hypothetical protein A3K24_02880 [candidate division Kazan bacterium RIFCSPHIGHO2_01_FULL_44_14]
MSQGIRLTCVAVLGFCAWFAFDYWLSGWLLSRNLLPDVVGFVVGTLKVIVGTTAGWLGLNMKVLDKVPIRYLITLVLLIWGAVLWLILRNNDNKLLVKPT